MADAWATTIKDWATGAVLSESDLDTEVRDRMTAIRNAINGDTSADSEMWHGHKNGTLAARPAAGNGGRRYYATDLGVEFIDNGMRWDVIGVNTRIAEHIFEEFAFSNISLTFTTLPAGLNWSYALTGSATMGLNLNPGISEIRLATGTTSGSSLEFVNILNGTHYLMDQASDRVPALWTATNKTAATTDQTLYWGLAAPGGTATPNGIYFKRTDTGTPGNWRAITRSAGVETNTDTGIVGDTAFHFFEIFINTLGNITFYIDGTLEATHTTNIPTTTNLRLGHYITNAAAVAKTLHLDRLDWYAKR